MHGGDEMCRQRRYNLSQATNCAGATKCAITPPPTLLSCLRHTPNVTFYLDVLKYCGMIHAYLVLAIIGTGL